MIDTNKLSPMMRHYMEVKESYKDAILMYRLGDFYEMFFDDAVTVSRELELTLTGRDCGLDERAPMCGVPYHAVDTYISRLINKGYKVAICEQLSEPGKSKLVDRDVVRVITAGTVMEDEILDDKSNNYLASVFVKEDGVGLAYADLSTGEFRVCQAVGAKAKQSIENILNAIHAAEIIGNTDAKGAFSAEALYQIPVSSYYDYAYQLKDATKCLCHQFGVSTLSAYGVDDLPLGVSAAGALMAYLIETQKRSLGHFTKLTPLANDKYMFFDTATRRNLELTETIRNRRKTGTLLWLLDETHSAMGARTLRNWIDAPLLDGEEINLRLGAVEELTKNVKLRTSLVSSLTYMRDLERLAGRVAYGSVNPHDMQSIGQGLSVLPAIKKLLSSAKSPLLQSLCAKISTFDSETDVLTHAIAAVPARLISEGGYIADGFNAQLDEYRQAEKNGRDWVLEMEAKERAETGIKTLKIKANQVFGYCIEVTNLNKDLVPERYIRKQTLVNAERYKTPELVELENKIFGAKEKAVALEIAIFGQLKQMLAKIVPELLETAKAVGSIDALNSFATVSVNNNYVKPTIGPKVKTIEIVDGRHPVIEKLLGAGKFAPNDATFDQDCKTMVITGPNMAGKSTYMRQVALIVLMAHIGCFVPARTAKICLVDRIFTRVGASDDLTSSQSTFMVEMIEVANIMHNATPRSLLVLDEIGRGTSTCDGLAIAWSTLEYVTNVLGAKTMFATHYHELTDLEGKLDGVKNFRILVNEVGDNIVFLHRIARGGTNKSFGIEVAGLAGVPKSVCDRAKEIAKQLESHQLGDSNAIMMDAIGGIKQTQMSMFTPDNKLADEVIDTLKDTHVERLTPMQAMVILDDLVKKVKGE